VSGCSITLLVVGRSWVAAFASAVFVVGAALAGPAAAQPPLTESEQDFIGSVAPQGYSGDVYGTLEAGYRVCSLLDDGMSHEGIARFVADTFGDSREHAGYYASLFAQYATYNNLCPRHIGVYGPI
jgi:hypothetical protein